MKFIIIGSGNIAKTYVSAISKVDGAEVVGVVSSKTTKPEGFTNFPFFKSLSEVAVDFDAVAICTPNGVHHISAVEAANMGKQVLCEKTIDITTEAADKMIEACKANDVKLAISYQRRFSSDNPVVKSLIEDGKLGRIFSVDLSVKNYRDDVYYASGAYRGGYEIDGGGPFIQQAAHYIDLYYWFFGNPSKLVSKLGTFVHDIEVEDHGAVICAHDSGLIGTITASSATKPGFPAKLEVYTDKGYFVMINDVITEWEIEGVENPTQQNANGNTHTGSSSAAVNDTSNHELIIKDFISAVENNREPLVSGESARNATDIITRIYNSQF